MTGLLAVRVRSVQIPRPVLILPRGIAAVEWPGDWLLVCWCWPVGSAWARDDGESRP